MKFDSFNFDEMILPFPELEHIMKKVGFFRGGPWDWKRATYDYKLENQKDGSTYYLRFPVVAVVGEIERYESQVKLLTPYVGQHFYPHGIEYDVEFPDFVVKTCETKLNETMSIIQDFLS